ncbi:MAG: cob(I)yrinic acid a,c-diamide adenosyltransferase [Gemmatimonadetes bacterium]|nr:cob(I)yrinic acid a,c-diamide adenosyltransferase [Gemmatimonadota bacterium]
MKIYTRGGDGGQTTLIGGVRVDKDDPRVAAYGTVDELNATLGLALAFDEASSDGTGVLTPDEIHAVQEDLFTIGARLAAIDPERAVRTGTIPTLAEDRTTALEDTIDRLDAELPTLDAFVLPGGSLVASQLHAARTVCRRAERKVVGLTADRPDLNETIVPYLNRLSDLLFTLARFANRRAGRDDTSWVPQRRREDGE